MLFLALPARGQELVGFNVPTSMCAGGTDTVTFGYLSTHNIVIDQQHATLGHSERIFLPDGVPCGNLGCSYRSPVTFSAFQPGATITSVQDIKYVRLNMEHSFIGDIYINITCPNNQKAHIMRFGGSNTAVCHSAIPSNAVDWLSGNNASGSTYFGIPYDHENSANKCDSNANGNEPGTGWNYCWSNNTTSGYSYASGDGIIYRYAHAHNGKIDSSNVAARTNFYHPDQNFSSLIGCPLNGTWYIEVVDGYSIDNGYIFEWELALNADLIPQGDCVADSFLVTGYGVTILDDSSFSITAPEQLTHDTTVYYNYHIYSSCGNDIDTTAALTFHPNYALEEPVEGCEQYQFMGATYDINTSVTTYHTSVNGCDSNVTTRITIHPGYHLERSDTIGANELPYTFLGRTFTEAVSDTLLTGTTTMGCDSNVLFTLVVKPNVYTYTTDTVCADQTPYIWNGQQYHESTVDTLILHSFDGYDSIGVLNLVVLPVNFSDVTVVTIENELPYPFSDTLFYAPIDTLFRFTNTVGCDSSVHFALTVHYNHSYTHTLAICENQFPYVWMGHTFTQADSLTFTLHDIYGADSTVTLELSVRPSYNDSIDTTICDNTPFFINSIQLNQSGSYTIPLQSVEGCDSIINLTLTVNPHHETLIRDTVCASDGYTLDSVCYRQSGTYSTVFTNSYGCDSIITLQLSLLAEGLKADIKAIPLMVTLSNPDVRLYDCSSHSYSRQWFIDEVPYLDKYLNYTYPVESDSIPITLVAYSIEGCADTARTTLLIDRAALALPNVFTPNQGTNSTWQPGLREIGSLEIWIYNREGLFITYLEGLDASWDGTHDGTPCPQGTYVYNIKYRTLSQPEKLQSLIGTILLLR